MYKPVIYLEQYCRREIRKSWSCSTEEASKVMRWRIENIGDNDGAIQNTYCTNFQFLSNFCVTILTCELDRMCDILMCTVNRDNRSYGQ